MKQLQSIDDAILLAYLDGMLDEATHAQITGCLKEDRALQQQVERLRKLRYTLYQTFSAADVAVRLDPRIWRRVRERTFQRPQLIPVNRPVAAVLATGLCILFIAAVWVGMYRFVFTVRELPIETPVTTTALPSPTAVPTVRATSVIETAERDPSPTVTPTSAPESTATLTATRIRPPRTPKPVVPTATPENVPPTGALEGTITPENAAPTGAPADEPTSTRSPKPSKTERPTTTPTSDPLTGTPEELTPTGTLESVEPIGTPESLTSTEEASPTPGDQTATSVPESTSTPSSELPTSTPENGIPTATPGGEVMPTSMP